MQRILWLERCVRLPAGDSSVSRVFGRWPSSLSASTFCMLEFRERHRNNSSLSGSDYIVYLIIEDLPQHPISAPNA